TPYSAGRSVSGAGSSLSVSTTTSKRSLAKKPPTPPLRRRLASTIVTVSPKRERTSSRTDSRFIPSHRCRDKAHDSHALELELPSDLQVGEDGKPGIDVAGQPAQGRPDRGGAHQDRLAALLLGGGGCCAHLGQEAFGDLGVEGQVAAGLGGPERLQQGVLQQGFEGEDRQLPLRGVPGG